MSAFKSELHVVQEMLMLLNLILGKFKCKGHRNTLRLMGSSSQSAAEIFSLHFCTPLQKSPILP